MQLFMEIIVSIFSKYGSFIIFVFGVIISFGLMVVSFKILGQQKWLEELNSVKKKYTTNKSTRGFSEKEDDHPLGSPEQFLKYVKEFNTLCSWHTVLSKMIPIFPLMGILGTVTGLIQNTQANNQDELFGSLDTALHSTFWGLVFAIGLKVVDIVFPSRIINKANIIIDDYYSKLNIAEYFDETEVKVKE